MDIRLLRAKRLADLASSFGDTTCSSVPAGGDGGVGAGGGGSPPAAGQPPAQGQPPAAPPAQPPATPAPGIPAEEYAALQKRTAKAEKEAEQLRAQLKDPGFVRGLINNALGVKDDVDPNVLLQQAQTRATNAENGLREALVKAAVVSAASELGAHSPLDVADLFPAGGFELEAGRVKDYGAVKTAVAGFLQGRPYMVRAAAPAPVQGQPPAAPPAGQHPLGTPPVPPRAPDVPAGTPPGAPAFKILTEGELWRMSAPDRAKYIEDLKKHQGGRNGLPWQG